MKTLKERISQRDSLQETFMKKAKLLTVLGVMLAMGVTACTGTETKSSSTPDSTPSATSSNPSTSKSSSSSSSSSSSQGGGQGEVADPDGHHFGADEDVAADEEAGTAAYKKAACNDNDGFLRLKVNQSVVKYASGSSRKDGTPEGYTKLSKDNQSFSFKMQVDKNYSGKLYFFGCMDGWSTDGNRNAGFYRSGTPSAKVEVNGQALDASAQQNSNYRTYFGEDQIDTDMSSPSDHLSLDGYAPFAPVTLKAGVNEIKYTRVQTQNMLIKDFVFIVEEVQEWSAPEAVAAKGEGYVGYNLYTNNFNGSKKIEIRGLDGTLAEGSAIKSGTEEGYVKLDKNGNKISWKFDFGKAGVAMFYHLGFMDSYSANKDVLYAWTSTSGDHAPTAEGNFRLTVNEAKVDKSAYLNIRAEDLTKDGEAVFEESKNFSNLTMLPIGQAAIAAGDNVVTYERLGSYNYSFSKLVIVFYEHAHAAATAWQSDENGHWHACNDANCPLPDVKMDYAEHTWVADTSKTDHVAESCADENIHYEVCSVCGATREVKTPSTVSHAWVDKEAVKNSDNKDVIPMECSGCHHVGAKMNENDYSDASFDKDDDKATDAIRPSQNKPISYKIVVSKAGTYSLEFSMFCKSNGGVAMSQRKFSVKVNGNAATVDLDGTKTPDALGMSATQAVSVQLCSAITLNEGENTIEITCASYRLHYKGNLAVYEK